MIRKTFTCLNKRNNWFFLIGVLSSGIFGYYAVKNFKWNSLIPILRSVNPYYVILACFCFIFSFNLRALRWKYFLPNSASFSFLSLLSGIGIGYLFINILPGRVGDIIRPAYIAKANNEPYKICLYSIVVERIWELIFLLIIAVLILKFSVNLKLHDLNIKYSLLIVLISMGVFFLFFANSILKFFALLFAKLRFQFFARQLNDIAIAFDGNFKIERLASLTLLTIGIFFLEGMAYVFLLDSLHISIKIFEKFTVMVLTSLSLLFPSAPSGVGVFHYFFKRTVMLFNVDPNLALSGAIFVHAFIFIFDFVFALFIYKIGPLNFSGFMETEHMNNVSNMKTKN